MSLNDKTVTAPVHAAKLTLNRQGNVDRLRTEPDVVECCLLGLIINKNPHYRACSQRRDG